ncbi:IS66 family insertion sequence element accessory protein TnpA [Dyadobacter sp. 50-39]|uniref:IS66 family insertion sequence element accessory protein TnpA n=1 Tax=Dyadobacter sp. 50-39 TaxID=1895756 RepID=UPI0038D4FE56
MLRLVTELELGDYDRKNFSRLHGISVSKLDYWRTRCRGQNSDRCGFLDIHNEPEPVLLEVVYPGGVLSWIKRTWPMHVYDCWLLYYDIECFR